MEQESVNVNIAIKFVRVQLVLHCTKGLTLFTVIRASLTLAPFRSMLQSTTLTKQTMHSIVSTAPRVFLLTQRWNNMWNHPMTLKTPTNVSGVEGHFEVRLISQSISGFTNRSPMSVNCVAKFSHHLGISGDTSTGPTSSEHHQKPLTNLTL